MGKGIAIREAIKKYGKDNFDKEIIEYIEDDEKHNYVSEKEKFWIKELNSMSPNGYNISPGGEGGCTKESAKKIVATRRKNGNNNPSEETKRKISKAHKGVSFSKSHKKHLSDNHRNKRNTQLYLKMAITKLQQNQLEKLQKNTIQIKIL